jgi:hypothetical protein
MPTYNFPVLMEQGVTPLFEQPSTDFPSVYYTIEVFKMIEYIVYKQDKEVAWMGLVEKLSDTEYLIYKIYIPKQVVASTSVDISENAIAELVNKIMDEGHDPSELRYHGHSHVNMEVHPSITDQQHMAEYIENADYFIREIRNKKTKSKVDVFDKNQNKVFHCVNTEIYELLQEQKFYDELDTQMKQHITNKVIPPLKNRDLISPWQARQRYGISKIGETDAELLELMADPFYVRD